MAMTTARNTRTEFVLSVIAFAAAAVPVLMLVFEGMATMSSMGMSMMDVMQKPPDPAMKEPMLKGMYAFMAGYTPYAIVPAILVLVGIWLYAAGNYPRLANRIAAGAAASFIASLGLDVVRLIGVAQGAFPGDMPTMFGQMITGRKHEGRQSAYVSGPTFRRC